MYNSQFIDLSSVILMSSHSMHTQISTGCFAVTLNETEPQRFRRNRGLTACAAGDFFLSLRQPLLFVSNTRILYNCEFWDFDFQAAAAVFIGAKKRLHVSVPSIETPSARQAAMAVLFDWNRTAATAFDKQLLIAQAAASGEDVSARMVGKQVEEKKKEQETKTKAAASSSSSSCWCLLNVGQFALQLPLLFSLRRPACPPQQFRFRPRPKADG